VAIARPAGFSTGLVVAARGTVDLELVGTATVLSAADVEGVARGLRQQRARAAKVDRRLGARVDAERSSVQGARDARRRAVEERDGAVEVLERFERGLGAVVDATASLADAEGGEAYAEQELAIAEERSALLARHRADLDGAVREMESRLRYAEDAARAGAVRAPEECAALGRSAVSAGAAADAADRAHAQWLGLEEELRHRHEQATSERGQLRAAIEGLRSQLEDHGGARETALRVALSTYEAATQAPTDALAVAMADRWRHAHETLAYLDLVEPLPTPEQLDAARAHVRAAELELSGAAASAQSGSISAHERDEIERAHAAATKRRALHGRRAAQGQREAEERLAGLLAAHGLTSWVEYLTTGLCADGEKKAVVADAAAGVAEAHARLAELEAASLGSDERRALNEEVEGLERNAVELLGYRPQGDLERHLRAQPLVDPACAKALWQALADAGVDTAGQPIAAAAHRWLDEIDGCRRARSEVEALLAHAVARQASIEVTDLGPDFQDIGALVAAATATLSHRAEQQRALRDLLGASVALLEQPSSAGEASTVLVERLTSLEWAVSAVEADTTSRHRDARRRREDAGAARCAAQEALSAAWAALRHQPRAALPDLQAATAHLEALLAQVAARNDDLGASDDAHRRAMAALDAAEAELAAHRAACGPMEPSAATVIARLLAEHGPEGGPVVLDDPFPALTRSELAQLVPALATVALERLVVLVVGDAVLPSAARPPVGAVEQVEQVTRTA
jgi:hypothetical protein